MRKRQQTSIRRAQRGERLRAHPHKREASTHAPPPPQRNRPAPTAPPIATAPTGTGTAHRAQRDAGLPGLGPGVELTSNNGPHFPRDTLRQPLPVRGGVTGAACQHAEQPITSVGPAAAQAHIARLRARSSAAERIDNIRAEIAEADRVYAENLAAVRKAADLTQVELAKPATWRPPATAHGWSSRSPGRTLK